MKEHIADYFPDDPKSVNRAFFWSVWRKLDQEKAMQYIKMAIDSHCIKKKVPEHRKLVIDPSFVAELLEHDVPSKYTNI